MSLRWYAHYLQDYEDDTRDLTMQQDGCYRRLMDHCYKTEGPLPSDLPAVHRIARAMTKAERQDVSFVLNRYFALRENGWHNKRIDEELDRAATLSETRSKAASKRHANAPAIADTVTSTVTKKERKKNISFEREFNEFWEAYPRKESKGHALKAWPKAVSLATPEQIIAGAKAYRARRAGEDAQFTKYPATWLSGMCWLDYAVALNGQGPSLDELLAAKERAEKAGIKTDKLDRAIAEKRCGQAA
jgi:uncharacterized protein YdaU (DUF1376 family)